MKQTSPVEPKHSFGILDYMEQLGFEPELSSRALGWNNLSGVVFPVPAWVPPLEFPAIFEEDGITVQLSNFVRFNVRIGDESFSTVGTFGTFSSAPYHLPTMWHIQDGPAKSFSMNIKHELLMRVALEVLDIDPKYVNLAGKVGENDPFIHQVSQQLLDEMKAKGLAGSLFVDSLTQSLVIHLLRKYVVVPRNIPSVKGKLHPKVLRSVLDFIDEYLEENLSLERIAGVASLSTFHFSRLFKQTMNIPVHQYVLQKRLDRGKDLLTSGRMTIAEVAIRAGFTDTSHFDRHFKRRFGISPGMLTK